MRRSVCLLLAVVAALWLNGSATAETDADKKLWEEFQKLPWKSAPAVGQISSTASIRLSGDLRFLDPASTSRFLELNGNPPRANNYALAPKSIDWFAVFSFDSSGYVKDNEKIDPDQLLEILKEQNRHAIEERKRLNLPVITLEGWFVAPHYDVSTRRLEWGTKLKGEDGSVTVNYSIRLLGRRGVMSAILVSQPESLSKDIRAFKDALGSFDFNSGERYAEYQSGDKVAEYGLMALIVGGAAAAAAKTGILKFLFKFGWIGLAALGALVFGGLRRIFSRR